jgi:hypothetical protein
MRVKIGIFVVLVSITLLFGSQVLAAENLTPTPEDVALLTGLRTDADSDAEAIIATRIGPIFLHRQNNDSFGLVTDGATTEYLNASELDLCWAVGYDFTVEARRGAFGGEVRYFGVPEWSRSRGAVTVPASTIPYMVPISLGGTHEVSGSYESMLHSVELNFKWFPMDRLSVLAGPRFLKIDEELDINWVEPGAVFTNRITAENTLFGGQIGVEGVFFNIHGFSADGWLKAGYYTNRMESAVSISGTAYASSDATRKGTFVGDLGINLNYAITPKILLTMGYQLLWIGNAALAPLQVPVHDPGVTGTGSTADDHVLYQGIRAGVVFLFDIYGKPSVVAPAPAPVIEPKLEPMSKN